MKNLIALLVACSSFYQVVASHQTAILTPNQLMEVLVDLELTQALVYEDIPHDLELAQTTFQAQIELIFKAHAIDQALFQESYFHYLADPKQFKSIQEQLITQLEKLLKEAEEKK